MIAQAGKEKFLQHRADAIAHLLKNNIAVALPDLRGTGETRPGNDRGQYSWDTSLAASQLMLGQPLLGQRLTDLLQTINYLKSRKDLNHQSIALWGDSFSKPNNPTPLNTPDSKNPFKSPLRIDNLPRNAEPLGPTLALLTSLFHKNIKAVYTHRGLISYRNILQSRFIHLPFDTIIPNALKFHDLPDLTAALAPTPLHLESMTNAWNQPATEKAIQQTYHLTAEAYQASKSPKNLNIQSQSSSDAKTAAWLTDILNR